LNIDEHAWLDNSRKWCVTVFGMVSLYLILLS